MAADTLTQKALKESLYYDPETGIFTRKIKANTAKVGDIAGGKTAVGYIAISVRGKGYLAHRLAFLYMEGIFPTDQIDHINHNKSDNRWSNLCHVTNTTNHHNLGKRITNTSGVTGVSWGSCHGKWEAYITVGLKRYNLGIYDDLVSAARKRAEAEIEFGFHKNHGLDLTG